ncbi:hypothetical protein SAMN06265795_1187 [Noviherbaspirillum humi]|uniref:Calcineurin-like phosphoesterase domain-containing protein n=1 Tax=Noviherbaspirillum humi TaxID=1688639 RepID=A0A239L046_9BURK|nr:metallophosphoesterase [Noviherbaspirillum humi]SNT22924.1 hypothetical protein SAMN06265795_1187 [Noviherbaspirillum humi]
MISRTFALALAIVAALHGYIGWRLLPALPGQPWASIAGTLFLLASLAAIPAGLTAHGIRRQSLADRITWVGMLAMGLFSTLLVTTLLRDLALLAAGLLLLDADLNVWRRWSALAVLAASGLISLIGFVNARRVARIRRVDVPIAGLPQALHGFSIAQISDIHVGPTIKQGYLARIVDAVNRLEADMVAITGDLVDGSVAALGSHVLPLERLSARHGAYFVTGNHEYYSNVHAWLPVLRRLGLRVLMNEHVILSHNGGRLLLAGVTDYSAHHFDRSHRSDPQAALQGADPDHAVRILLAHQPRTAAAAAEAGFDLQLSGHTHGGQFFPWNFFVPLQQPFVAGLNRLQQLWVYTSRGTGYWGPPKRFGAPSEITHIRLVPA